MDTINLNRRFRVVELTRQAIRGTLAGSGVAVLGLAFKPGSDDVRDSLSLHVCGLLSQEGEEVTVHDPVAMENAARLRSDMRYADSVWGLQRS